MTTTGGSSRLADILAADRERFEKIMIDDLANLEEAEAASARRLKSMQLWDRDIFPRVSQALRETNVILLNNGRAKIDYVVSQGLGPRTATARLSLYGDKFKKLTALIRHYDGNVSAEITLSTGVGDLITREKKIYHLNTFDPGLLFADLVEAAIEAEKES